jgi:hypothetical protein
MKRSAWLLALVLTLVPLASPTPVEAEGGVAEHRRIHGHWNKLAVIPTNHQGVLDRFLVQLAVSGLLVLRI